jgi:hypothetical protein
MLRPERVRKRTRHAKLRPSKEGAMARYMYSSYHAKQLDLDEQRNDLMRRLQGKQFKSEIMSHSALQFRTLQYKMILFHAQG